jgi:mono/diheme cytochrome c family protein
MSPRDLVVGAVVILAAAAGCRGGQSEDPPLHLQTDMDWQAHRRAQSISPLFKDKRAMRPIDPHTVAHSREHAESSRFIAGGDPGFRERYLKDDDAFFRGVDTAGKPLARVPFEVSAATVDRGEDRYNIYCTPCHDKAGSGQGMVIQRAAGGFPRPVALYIDRLKDAPDGEIFQTITNGKGNMPAYAAQIPEEDRWAIVTWVRVLQQSQNAKIDDVPETERAKIKPAAKEAK